MQRKFLSGDAIYSNNENFYAAQNLVRKHKSVVYKQVNTNNTYQRTLLAFPQRYLNPGNFKLNQWACIPDSLNDLIQRCTGPEPSRRPSLTTVEQMLAVISTETFPHGKLEALMG